MDSRKIMKRNAKKSLKKHYLIFLAVCLLAILIGSEFGGSFQFLGIQSDRSTSNSTTTAVSSDAGYISSGNDLYGMIHEGLNKQIKTYKKDVTEFDKTSGPLGKAFGHRTGFLAAMVNGIGSGAFSLFALQGINSIIQDRNSAAVIFIVIALILSFIFWFFIKNTYQVMMRRIFLEGRNYEKVTFQRLLFIFRVKKLKSTAVSMFVLSVFSLLWDLTIIGGFIKHYSYLMTPYIVAENPGIKARDAINLSRKMMNGHKWQYFKNDVTFTGWFLLGGITLGITDLFFTNMYRTAYFTECYYNLRKNAKENEIEGSELLFDRYLFEHADEDVMKKYYSHIPALLNEDLSEPEELKHGIRGFLARWFGISFFSREFNDAYAELQNKKLTLEKSKDQYECLEYPGKLYPIEEGKKNPRLENLNYMRLYSFLSLILMFFTFCIIGWLWEGTLHLVKDGYFPNRGTMHGPWLPIYGSGGIAILLLLKKFRKNPVVEFIAGVIVCGIIEYGASVMLEINHNGMKWWDYSGHMLNINGRVCAEGLFVFGLAGCAGAYLLAPMFDNFFRKIKTKTAALICTILVAVFLIDMIYSHYHPNMGVGITDYNKNKNAKGALYLPDSGTDYSESGTLMIDTSAIG